MSGDHQDFLAQDDPQSWTILVPARRARLRSWLWRTRTQAVCRLFGHDPVDDVPGLWCGRCGEDLGPAYGYGEDR